MSVLDLNALNALPKVERILALAETNAQLEKLDAEGRVAWALENLPGDYVLSSSFGIQAAVSLHLVNQIRPDIPVNHRYRLSVPGSLSVYRRADG
ncbi:hypothetical protein ACVXG7_14910 [Enterobacter hormaechei]